MNLLFMLLDTAKQLEPPPPELTWQGKIIVAVVAVIFVILFLPGKTTDGSTGY